MVYMFALCLLLTLDTSLMVNAGTVTKIRKLENALDEFEWCCIKRGCPYLLNKKRQCRVVMNGKKVDCKCIAL